MDFLVCHVTCIENNETFMILTDSASFIMLGQRSLKGAFKNGSKLFGQALSQELIFKEPLLARGWKPGTL